MALTLSQAKAAMGPEHTRMSEIVRDVSFKTGVSVADISGRSKVQNIARARQLAMWQGKQLGLSLNQIGRFWGFDHTTIIHGIKATQARIDAANQE